MRGVIIPLQQGTPEWEDWRHNGIGGSDMPSLLGISPYDHSEPEDLFKEKVTRIRKPINFAMGQGHKKEPRAVAAYLAKTETDTAQAVCVEHPNYPWARCSLDLYCTLRAAEWIVEVKALKKERHLEAVAGFVPYFYQSQCQWQLFCTGLDRLVYLSYSELESIPEPKRLAPVEVQRDDALIRRLLDRAAEFWLRVLDAREEYGT